MMEKFFFYFMSALGQGKPILGQNFQSIPLPEKKDFLKIMPQS